MREIAHTGAAILFLDGDPVQPERAHLRPQLDREAVGAVDFRSNRSDPVLGEAANRGPQHVDLRTEVKIERGKPRVLHTPYIAQECGCGEGGAISSPTMRTRIAPLDAAHDIGARVGPRRHTG